MNKELYPFKNNYLDLDGHKYHYVDEGPTNTEGQGDAVLMVHGNPTWSFYYRNLIKKLSATHRVIAPDHIGCGLSDKPSAKEYQYTLSQRVADLDRLIKHLGLEKFTLVVHDWGGMIGMAWAVQHPEAIERCIISNTGAFHLPKDKGFPKSIALARFPGLGKFLVKGFSAFSRGANRYCVTRKKLPKEVAEGYLMPYDSWANRVAVYHFVEDIPLKPSDRAYQLVSDTAEKLPLLNDKPIQLLWGMQDFVFDKHFLAEWQKYLPSAETHRFEDAGHYLLEDAFDDVMPLIERFLQSSN